jgi:uncharacterized paraquat-inducible protein A
MQNAPNEVGGLSAEAVLRQCFNCNYEALAIDEKCPRCRSTKFLTSRNIRTRGGALVVVGLFIAGLMGAIAILVAGLLLNSKNPDTIRSVNEEFSTFLAIYAFFAGLILLGVHFAISGIWMLIAGKRSRVLLWIMWALLFAVWVGGGVVIGLTGGR